MTVALVRNVTPPAIDPHSIPPQAPTCYICTASVEPNHLNPANPVDDHAHPQTFSQWIRRDPLVPAGHYVHRNCFVQWNPGQEEKPCGICRISIDVSPPRSLKERGIQWIISIPKAAGSYCYDTGKLALKLIPFVALIVLQTTVVCSLLASRVDLFQESPLKAFSQMFLPYAIGSCIVGTVGTILACSAITILSDKISALVPDQNRRIKQITRIVFALIRFACIVAAGKFLFEAFSKRILTNVPLTPRTWLEEVFGNATTRTSLFSLEDFDAAIWGFHTIKGSSLGTLTAVLVSLVISTLFSKAEISNY